MPFGGGFGQLVDSKEIKPVEDIPTLPTGKLDLKEIARLATGEEKV